ncbi:MAG: glutathionylspermidine synthase family protein [Phycisphaerales bacterium]
MRFFPGEWLENLNRKTNWHRYFSDAVTPQSNPATALLIQSKRLPLIWDELQTQMHFWKKYLPETKDVRQVKIDSGQWVLKPAFGRVGQDIGIYGVNEKKDWEKIVRYAKKHPRHWIAQKRFVPVAFETENGPMYPCIGVYTIDGKAAGVYGRISKQAIIDQYAFDAAVLVNRPKEATVLCTSTGSKI